MISMTSGATVFGFGVIDRCKLNMKSAQHKQKIGLQGFKHAVVMIIRVPGDTLAFSPRLAAGGCSSLSVGGGVCRFVAASLPSSRMPQSRWPAAARCPAQCGHHCWRRCRIRIAIPS